MIRGPLAIVLALSLCACGQDAPDNPGAPSPTRVIALRGDLAFGGVEVGGSKELTFSIGNTGSGPLTVTGITVPFRYTANWTSGQIPAGGSQTVTLRFEPWAPMSYDGTVTVSADQTSGTSTLALSGAGTRPAGRGVFGIMTDPVGDARPVADLISPDIVGSSIDVNAGTLTVTVSFAAGTLTEDVYCLVLLDTDENAGTGFNSDGGVLGADYGISIGNPRRSGQASLGRWEGQGLRTFATTGVAFTGTEARVTVSMSTFDNDEGRLKYKIQSGQWTASGGLQNPLDLITDSGALPGITR